MKYEISDRVQIKGLDWYNENKDRINEVACGNTFFIPEMAKYCEKIVTISFVLPVVGVYHIKEDGGMFNWTDDMIEGLVEEEVGLIDVFSSRWVNEFNLPEGYIFKDQDGNIINATKIVLEKI